MKVYIINVWVALHLYDPLKDFPVRESSYELTSWVSAFYSLPHLQWLLLSGLSLNTWLSPIDEVSFIPPIFGAPYEWVSFFFSLCHKACHFRCCVLHQTTESVCLILAIQCHMHSHSSGIEYYNNEMNEWNEMNKRVGWTGQMFFATIAITRACVVSFFEKISAFSCFFYYCQSSHSKLGYVLCV